MKSLPLALPIPPRLGRHHAGLVLARDPQRRHGLRLHRSRPRPRLRRHPLRGRHRLHRHPRSRTRSACPSTTWKSPPRCNPTALNEDDLAAGLFDDAAVEIWRVNWAETDQRVLMRSGSLGEVRRSGTAFTAEVRGLAAYLQQPKGRAVPVCLRRRPRRRALRRRSRRSRLPRHRHRRHRSERARQFAASGLDAFADGWFNARPGHLHQRRQRRAIAMEVKRHTARRHQRRDRAVAAHGPRIAPATASRSPPAATSASPPAARSSPTPSISAASRTCPATTTSSPSPAPANP